MQVARIVLLVALASVWLGSFMLNSEADTHSVIPAGNSATLGSPSVPADDTPQGKLLREALTKETRDTLQEAMNSSAH